MVTQQAFAVAQYVAGCSSGKAEMAALIPSKWQQMRDCWDIGFYSSIWRPKISVK